MPIKHSNSCSYRIKQEFQHKQERYDNRGLKISYPMLWQFIT